MRNKNRATLHRDKIILARIVDKAIKEQQPLNSDIAMGEPLGWDAPRVGRALRQLQLERKIKMRGKGVERIICIGILSTPKWIRTHDPTKPPSMTQRRVALAKATNCDPESIRLGGTYTHGKENDDG